MTDRKIKYLSDARDAARSVVRFTALRTYDDYLADEILRSAVERQLTIVGEALVHVRRLDPTLAASIPDIADILAFRNILVHAYSTVDHAVVWGIIENDMADLIAHLAGLLERTDEPSSG